MAAVTSRENTLNLIVLGLSNIITSALTHGISGLF